jgi:hypothetical protein
MDDLPHSDIVKAISKKIPEYIKVAKLCVGRLIAVTQRGGRSVDITDLGIDDDVIETLQSRGYVVQHKMYTSYDGTPAELYRILCG